MEIDARLLAYARAAFGWTGEVAAEPGPRGALGQIWRIEAVGERYALKEIFSGPPPEALLAAELAFTGRAAAAGVRLAAARPDRDGRYVTEVPGGRWLRLYEWLDLRPADLSQPRTAEEVGALIARLHRAAPAAPREPGGEPPYPWYERVPEMGEVAASASGAEWAGRLAEVLDTLPELCAAVAPADPASLATCHRDLHPGNVLAGPDGALVVVDWDDLGPAMPARELVRALFDWYCDGGPDLAAMRRLYAAYVDAGGPGRITGPADATMLLASRLNFLRRQVGIALDPHAEPRHRDWAEREIDEALHILPTPGQLAAVLAALSS